MAEKTAVAHLAARYVPRTLTSQLPHHSSGSLSANGFHSSNTPALVTSTSNSPPESCAHSRSQLSYKSVPEGAQLVTARPLHLSAYLELGFCMSIMRVRL